jgi:hypothetical protein
MLWSVTPVVWVEKVGHCSRSQLVVPNIFLWSNHDSLCLISDEKGVEMESMKRPRGEEWRP